MGDSLGVQVGSTGLGDRSLPSQSRHRPERERLGAQIAEAFTAEAHEVLATFRAEFLKWQQTPVDSGALRAIRRSFHTLKVAGRLAGATQIKDLSWSVENLLNHVITGTIREDAGISIFLDEVLAILPLLLADYRSGQPDNFDLRSLIGKLELFSANALNQPKYERDLSRHSGKIVPPTTENLLDVPASEKQACVADPPPKAVRVPALAFPPSSILPERFKRTEPLDPSTCTRDPVLLGLFITEARENLRVLRDCQQHPDPLNGTGVVAVTFRRALHTLHGNARIAGAAHVVQLVNELRRSLGDLPEGALLSDSATLQIISSLIVRIEAVLGSLERSNEPLADDSGARGAGMAATKSIPMASLSDDRQGHGSVLSGKDAAGTAQQPIEVGQREYDARQDPDLTRVFLEEASEILNSADGLIGKWRESPENKNIILELQRNLHTLKGSARMAAVRPIADLTHCLESALAAVQQERLPITDQLIDHVQQTEYRLVEMLQKVKQQVKLQTADSLISTLRAFESAEEQADCAPLAAARLCGKDSDISSRVSNERLRVAADEVGTSAGYGPGFAGQVRVNAYWVEQLARLGCEASISGERIGQQMRIWRFQLQHMAETVDRMREHLCRMAFDAGDQVLYRHEQAPPVEREGLDPLTLERSPKVQQRSQSMLESLSELVSICQELERCTTESEASLAQYARVMGKLQLVLMAMRLASFSEILPRLRHLARQTAQELGKNVQLRVVGSEVKIERTVLNRLVCCLEHMIRNAIDHGIESPKIRASRGKAETGTIDVRIFREASAIMIALEDDGAGLAFEDIRQKSVECGFVRLDEDVSQHELAQFILRPGFSTASKLSHISGRGIGMDIVNTVVAQLKGNLEIDSKFNQGTTFRLRLPSVHDVIQALTIKVGGNSFAIPCHSVEAVVRIHAEANANGFALTIGEIAYRGQIFPLCDINPILGFAEGAPRSCPSYRTAILLRAGEYRAGFLADEVFASREIIIKPIGPMPRSMRWLSGATFLPDGSNLLVLDASYLARLGGIEREDIAGREYAQSLTTALGSQPIGPTVLLVDDSITVRKAIASLLERKGMRVITARDGADALFKLQSERPDVMLIDVEMPVMNGYEVARKVRSDSCLEHLPMIMISGCRADQQQQLAKKIGVTHFLEKPYSENQLLACVQELIGKI